MELRTAFGVSGDPPPLPPAAALDVGCRPSDLVGVERELTCELADLGAVLRVRLREWGDLIDTQTVEVWAQVRP
jgi:hypothetical protein